MCRKRRAKGLQENRELGWWLLRTIHNLHRWTDVRWKSVCESCGNACKVQHAECGLRRKTRPRVHWGRKIQVLSEIERRRRFMHRSMVAMQETSRLQEGRAQQDLSTSLTLLAYRWRNLLIASCTQSCIGTLVAGAIECAALRMLSACK